MLCSEQIIKCFCSVALLGCSGKSNIKNNFIKLKMSRKTTVPKSQLRVLHRKKKTNPGVKSFHSPEVWFVLWRFFPRIWMDFPFPCINVWKWGRFILCPSRLWSKHCILGFFFHHKSRNFQSKEASRHFWVEAVEVKHRAGNFKAFMGKDYCAECWKRAEISC